MFVPEYNMKIAFRPYYGVAGLVYLVLSGLNRFGIADFAVLRSDYAQFFVNLRWPLALGAGLLCGFLILVLEYVWIRRRANSLVSWATSSPTQSLKSVPRLLSSPEPWLIYAVLIALIVVSVKYPFALFTAFAGMTIPMAYVGPHVKDFQKRLREGALSGGQKLEKPA